MEDALPMHIFDGSDDLEHVEFDFLVGEWVFLAFQTFVQIHVHKLEYESKFAWIIEGLPLG